MCHAFATLRRLHKGSEVPRVAAGIRGQRLQAVRDNGYGGPELERLVGKKDERSPNDSGAETGSQDPAVAPFSQPWIQ